MILIICISIFFQLTAIYFSFRLIKLTKRYGPWLILLSAVVLMAVRRIVVLWGTISLSLHETHSLYAEITALIISILLSAGLYLLMPVFKNIQNKEILLRNKTDQLQKAKDTAEESEKFLETVFENLPHMIFVKDAEDLKFVKINKTAENILGINKNEIIGKSDYDFFPKAQSDQFTKKDRETLSRKNIVTIEHEKIQTRNGERILYTKKIAICDKYEKSKYLLGISEDITDKIQTNQKLLQAKEAAEINELRLLTFINSVPDIVCYKDGEGRWLLANDADLELFCLNGVEYYGKTDSELAAYTHQIYKSSFEACIESDEKAWHKASMSKGIEIIPTVSGENKVYEVYKVPVFYPDGSRKGLAVIGRDITELNRTRENLIKAKNEAEAGSRLKTQFIHNMSHEIRTPMNGIIGFSNLLSETSLSENTQKIYIQIIQKSSRQLLRIIDDILEISELETKHIQINEDRICFIEELENLYKEYEGTARTKAIQFELDSNLPSNQAHVKTDKQKIRKILKNLLENAFKFTEEGKITIRAKLVKKGKSTKIEISVKDTGIGISEENKSIIFDRFTSGNNAEVKILGGLGLGLAIAKENALLLGGNINFQSIPEKGSEFVLELPYTPVQTSGSMNTKGVNSSKDDCRKVPEIMVAEDEETNRFFLETVIRMQLNENLSILHANNGKEAVELCRQHPNLSLILMDLKMPVMNGFEATKIIKKEFPDIIIIAQTAYTSSEDTGKATEFGCDGFITKPIDPDLLIETLAKYIEI